MGPPPEEEASLPTKAVWYATELFGKAAALVRSDAEPVEESLEPPPASVEEAIGRLERDYAGTAEDPRPYFLTGKMDVSLYDVDCEFADPFVSFRGRQRFKENLENLAGGFIVDSSVRTLDTKTEPNSYTTRLLVKLQLGLPWKPVLAWPWGVEHVFDPSSGLIVQHIESWEVSAAEGVRQLLKPGPPRGLKQGRSAAAGEAEAEEGGAASKLGTMDPIAGPLVKAARAVGLMPKEEADGWTGEPSAWAEQDSFTQKLSAFSQTRLAGFKQWAAERVAGEYDAAAIDARLDADIGGGGGEGGEGGVVMFSFTTCPFCKKAKEALDAKRVAYTAIELDLEADGAAMRARLGARTSRTSVPSIWIGGEYVGGLNDGPGILPLDAEGALEPKLRAVGALASAD